LAFEHEDESSLHGEFAFEGGDFILGVVVGARGEGGVRVVDAGVLEELVLAGFGVNLRGVGGTSSSSSSFCTFSSYIRNKL
jgi:hypothetical protein